MFLAVPDFTANADKPNYTKCHDDRSNNDDWHARHIPECRIDEMAKGRAGHQEVKPCANIGEKRSFVGQPGAFDRQVFAKDKVFVHGLGLFKVNVATKTRRHKKKYNCFSG